ncbi:MAG: hypothetical protein HC817_01320 [Saprospiraceae bacterium]|nr:hypothetical protein [Saprospiraceae bacterium]
MKNIIQSYNLSLLTFIALTFLASCDLAIQKPYEFEPELPTLTTFKDQTAWDWIQKEKTADTAKVLNNEKFDLLVQSIKSTGLQEEFSKAGDKRTFLLLNNAAFLGTGKILALLITRTTGTVLTIDTLSAANKVRLGNILKYHIIPDAYVDQRDALPVLGVPYDFKTLGTAPNDALSIQRADRYGLTLNTSGNLPATKRTITVYRHNYQFGNGIGHILNNYAGLAAY